MNYNSFRDKDGFVKSLSDCTLEDLALLDHINNHLPDGVQLAITDPVLSKIYTNIDDYIIERSDNYFNVGRADYEKIVGKCFMNDDDGTIIKVLALPDKMDVHHKFHNFIYEMFYRYSDGSWHVKDYNWLQDDSGEHNLKYIELSTQADMNIDKEGMFILGLDGNLYVNDGSGYCNYTLYTPVKEIIFQIARTVALENLQEEDD